MPDAGAGQDSKQTANEDSADVKRLKEEIAQRELELRKERLALESKAEEAKLAKEIAGSVLPESLDTEIQKDELTMKSDSTGLTTVFTHRASVALADDIADLVLSSLQGNDAEVLIVQDSKAMEAIEKLRMLEAQIDVLEGRFEEALPEPAFTEELALGEQPREELPREPQPHALLAMHPALAVTTGLAKLVPSGIGLLTKLLARQYTVTGTAASVDSSGFDLAVAGALISKREALTVVVDRLRPTPESQLLRRVAALMSRAHREVQSAISECEAELSATKEEALQCQKLLDITRERISELIKTEVPSGSDDAAPSSGALDVYLHAEVRLARALSLVTGTPAEELQKHLTSLGTAIQTAIRQAGTVSGQQELQTQRELERQLIATLPELKRAEARAEQRKASFTELRDEVDAFVTTSVSGEGGTVPPLIQAARGQWLLEAAGGSRFILYTRLLSGGIDQVIDTKVGPDRRTILAGVVAEFGLVDGTGRAFRAGVRSNLWGGTTKLDRLTDFRGTDVSYVPVIASRNGRR